MSFFKRKEQQERIEPVAPSTIANHPAWFRLEQQISWYDGRSRQSQRRYKILKVFSIVLAVSIPLISHLEPEAAKWLTSIAGASIAVIEGIQHMNQYAMLWVSYRSTAERLKHEKYLFLSNAGPYKGLSEAERPVALAERIEEHVSTEHANWFDETRRNIAATKRDDSHK